MNYMLMFYETETERSRRNTTEAGAYWGAWSAYIEALNQSGIVRGGAGLQLPETATTVRISNDKRLVQDGPFSDSREQLGGFMIIEVEDLDTALEWAGRAPCAAAGGVEVRPEMPPMQG